MFRPFIRLLLLLLLYTDCGNDSEPVSGGDVIPPAAVSDLEATTLTDSSLLLVWTAPGEDSAVGAASAYDVRFSPRPDSLANWWSSHCNKLDGVPVPKPSGEIESLYVAGLDTESTYYFALRASDEVPNWSAVSNVARGRCAGSSQGNDSLPAPDDSIPTPNDSLPPAAISDLEITETAEASVVLAWSPPGDDGLEGTAAAYEIRHRVTRFTEEEWGLATPLPDPPAPIPPGGERHSYLVTGLDPRLDYFFAIRSVDEAGNRSGISNVVRSFLPQLEVTPDSLHFIRASGPLPVWIKKWGNGTLPFSIRSNQAWLWVEPEQGFAGPPYAGTEVAVRVERSLLPEGQPGAWLYVSTGLQRDSVRVTSVPLSTDSLVTVYLHEVIDVYDADLRTFLSAPHGIPNQTFRLGDHVRSTDGEGYSFLEGVDPGTYRLVVERPDFHPIDTLVFLSPPAELLVPLRPVLADYYPLGVGNRYTYHYVYSNYFSNGSSAFVADVTWEIVGMATGEEDTLYAVRWSSAGAVYPPPEGSPRVAEGEGTLRQAGNRVFFENLGSNSPSTSASLIRRHCPLYNGQVVEAVANTWSLQVKLRLGVGFSSWHEVRNHQLHQERFSMDLTDWYIAE